MRYETSYLVLAEDLADLSFRGLPDSLFPTGKGKFLPTTGNERVFITPLFLQLMAFGLEGQVAENQMGRLRQGKENRPGSIIGG